MKLKVGDKVKINDSYLYEPAMGKVGIIVSLVKKSGDDPCATIVFEPPIEVQGGIFSIIDIYLRCLDSFYNWIEL